MRKYHSNFQPNHFYHVFNRAIGDANLFREKKNYVFFLNKWDHYLSEYLDTWAYCLIPNHFHFLVKVKEIDNKDLPGFENLAGLISQKLSNFFNSYTKSFNKIYDRNGSLFQRPFKRIKVDSQDYLYHLIHYIHHNPIHHNFVDEYMGWEYSSYHSILSKKPTRINREGMLKLFGHRGKFRSYHEEMKNYNQISHLIPE